MNILNLYDSSIVYNQMYEPGSLTKINSLVQFEFITFRHVSFFLSYKLDINGKFS